MKDSKARFRVDIGPLIRTISWSSCSPCICTSDCKEFRPHGSGEGSQPGVMGALRLKGKLKILKFV